ncbi:MAG: response regulator transcription factor [Lachnospiraceae bacterium]|nr:response regulator transcription factor [Lachnospiraceae bacterium]
MIHIAICDDNQEEWKDVVSMVEKCCRKAGRIYHKEIFEESIELLDEVKNGAHFDIFLLDIEMPQIDGIELAAKLRLFLPYAIVFFITSYEKYVYEAFKAQPYRFIPKSQMESMFPAAIDDALQLIAEQERKFYIVENKRMLEKVPVKSIAYIWHRGKYGYIEKINGENTKVRKSLKKIYEELPAEDFVWADRGCIVGSMHIERITGKEVVLVNGTKLPIGQERLTDLKNKIRDYWMEKG